MCQALCHIPVGGEGVSFSSLRSSARKGNNDPFEEEKKNN